MKRLLPALTLCIALAVLSGAVVFFVAPAARPAWISGLLLASAAGVLALAIAISVRALRRQTERALEDAEHPHSRHRAPARGPGTHAGA